MATSLYIRARVTLEDALEAACRLAASVEATEISQFDIDRLARAVGILQTRLNDRIEAAKWEANKDGVKS